MTVASAAQVASPSHVWWVEHRRLVRWATVAVPIGVVALLLTGFPYWVPKTVTLSGYATTTGTCAIYTCPARIIGWEQLPNQKVTVTWTDISGGVVLLEAVWNYHPGWTEWPAFAQVGTNGSGSFVPEGGSYAFVARDEWNQSAQQVDYTLTYTYDASIL